MGRIPGLLSPFIFSFSLFMSFDIFAATTKQGLRIGSEVGREMCMVCICLGETLSVKGMAKQGRCDDGIVAQIMWRRQSTSDATSSSKDCSTSMKWASNPSPLYSVLSMARFCPLTKSRLEVWSHLVCDC